MLAEAIHGDANIKLYQTVWYSKPQATFSEVLAAVRKAWWGARDATNYPAQERFPLITQPVLAVRPKGA